MTAASTSPKAPAAEALAERAVRDVLVSVHRGEPAVLVASPPGAGKTGLVVRAAAYAAGVLGERCAVAVQTNEQAFDLVRRLAAAYPSVPVTLFVREGLRVPGDVLARPSVSEVQKTADLPPSPGVVVANSAKWAWVQAPYPRFDVLVVDEAYQLSNARFQQIGGLADRFLLVGDPGQIPPVVSCSVERWEGDPSAPHARCPDALLAIQPALRRVRLPVSRRLVPDTVGVVQPAFYAGLPFVALTKPNERRLEVAAVGSSGLGRAIGLACKGSSIVGVELDGRMTGEEDPELAGAIVDLIAQLVIVGDAHVREGSGVRPLDADRIGVVCAHVSQVAAVQERLPLPLRGVLVETADRFQGLERDVVLVHHPLSGRAAADPFHLDPGRLCVMLSRHRVACFVLYRGGLGGLLESYAPTGGRPLGVAVDPEYAGWKAHRRFYEGLTAGRSVRAR